MMRKILTTAVLTTAMLLSTVTHAEDTLSAAQKAEVKNIIQQYLVEENPDVVRKAVQTLQQREQAQQMQTTMDAVNKNKKQIYENAATPVLGNPKGDVTVVEFFDYHCGYCKMAHAAIKDSLAKDKNLRFIAKEYPILGDESLTASRAALASVKQGKYDKIHNALMENRGAMNEAAIMDLAKKAGLDTEKLKKDMQDPSVDAEINNNRALAQELGVRGTPLFIIGSEIRPGAMNAEDLQKAIDEARRSAKK